MCTAATIPCHHCHGRALSVLCTPTHRCCTNRSTVQHHTPCRRLREMGQLCKSVYWTRALQGALLRMCVSIMNLIHSWQAELLAGGTAGRRNCCKHQLPVQLTHTMRRSGLGPLHCHPCSFHNSRVQCWCSPAEEGAPTTGPREQRLGKAGTCWVHALTHSRHVGAGSSTAASGSTEMSLLHRLTEGQSRSEQLIALVGWVPWAQYVLLQRPNWHA